MGVPPFESPPAPELPLLEEPPVEPPPLELPPPVPPSWPDPEPLTEPPPLLDAPLEPFEPDPPLDPSPFGALAVPPEEPELFPTGASSPELEPPLPLEPHAAPRPTINAIRTNAEMQRRTIGPNDATLIAPWTNDPRHPRDAVSKPRLRRGSFHVTAHFGAGQNSSAAPAAIRSMWDTGSDLGY
ncbi:MAG TPA: hypothetical protein VEK07_19830 [Polyangiaceae bacterium]|nr:hypothetical protein [Polyangiaceae bacterium]